VTAGEVATAAPAARPDRSVARATALVVLSACCFGSVIILTELGKRAGATLLTVLTWRYLLGAVLLVVAGGGARAVRVPRRRALTLLAVGGGAQATLAYLSLKALDYIPAATVSFLFYTYPSWVAVFAVLRRSEPVDGTRVAALSLSLLGILLMVGSPWAGALDPTGIALALAAAVVYALFIPTLGRLQAGVGPAVASAYVAGGTAVIFATAGLASGQLSVSLTPAAWGAVVALALFSTTLAFIVFLRGLAVLGPVRTAIVSTVEPFWTALLAVLALGQPLRPATLLGGALIASAVLLLQWRARARQ
jgi:drug/metabolite transporter (DMT)-like permease